MTLPRLMFTILGLLPSPLPWHGETPPRALPRYEVAYQGAHRFQVDATFARATLRLDLNHHGATGRPDGPAASIRALQAFDAAGKALPVTYVGEGTWQVAPPGAHRIRYEVLADHDAVSWRAGKEEVASRFDATYYFVGDVFFLVDYQWPADPIEVAFSLPKGWRVTSPWEPRGTHFLARGPEGLGSNAFALGTDASTTSSQGGFQIEWLADSRVQQATPALATLFERLPAAYSAFWGGSPGQRLNVFLLADTATDGGAFKNSFAMRLDTPLREAERPIWTHTMAHELMHMWMNQANQGIGRAEGGSHYWFTEGFTDYLTIKLMRQAGLLDRATTAQRVANLVRRYQLGRRLSPGIGMMPAGDKKHDNWEVVYGGGAMVALLLDAELSRQSPTAFRDLLRSLQHQGGRPMDGEALLNELDKGSGGQARAIFRELEAGMPLSRLRARLAPAGIHVEGFQSDEVYVDFAPCGSAPCADSLWGAEHP